jgi:hypothetical protein
MQVMLLTVMEIIMIKCQVHKDNDNAHQFLQCILNHLLPNMPLPLMLNPLNFQFVFDSASLETHCDRIRYANQFLGSYQLSPRARAHHWWSLSVMK